jgi:two-component system cell cycle response regulator
MISRHQPSPERIPAEPQELSLESLRANNERLTDENQELKEDRERLVKKAERLQKRKFATKDKLTGIENREGLMEKMSLLFPAQEKGPNKRDPEKQHETSVLILDIDKFKSINDENGGHAAGDHVLTEVTERLRRKIRIKENGKSDILCRWGGDEIVVVFWGANAQDIVNKFYQKDDGRAEFSFETEFNGKHMPITLSGGVTDLTPGETVEEAIERADREGLYEAKRAGRNRILMVSNE